jgi:hypothetical protein
MVDNLSAIFREVMLSTNIVSAILGLFPTVEELHVFKCANKKYLVI